MQNFHCEASTLTFDDGLALRLAHRWKELTTNVRVAANISHLAIHEVRDAPALLNGLAAEFVSTRGSDYRFQWMFFSYVQYHTYLHTCQTWSSNSKEIIFQRNGTSELWAVLLKVPVILLVVFAWINVDWILNFASISLLLSVCIEDFL